MNGVTLGWVARCIVLALVVLTGGAAALGQSYWAGNGDNISWTDPNNWSPAGVPAPGVPVYLNKTTYQHISVPAEGVTPQWIYFMGGAGTHEFSGGSMTLAGSAYSWWIYSVGAGDLIFNNDIIAATDTPTPGLLQVSRSATGSVVFNGRLIASDHVMLAAGGKAVLTGDNSGLGWLHHTGSGGEVVAGSPTALGINFRVGSNGTTLSLTSDVQVTEFQHLWTTSSTLRNRGAGSSGHTLTVKWRAYTNYQDCTVNVAANPDGGSNAVTVRLETVGPDWFNGFDWNTLADTIISLGSNQTGRVYMGVVDTETGSTIGGLIFGPGRMVVDSQAAVAVIPVAQSYTGGTTIQQGILLVNSGGSGTGTGAVTVAAAGMLGGTGVVDPGTGLGVLVNGTLAPGDDGVGTPDPQSPIGTLTVGSTGSPNTVSFGTTGRLNVDVDQTYQSDLLKVFGNLDLSLSPTLNVVGTLGPLGGAYTIATYSGSLTGTFGTVTGLKIGWKVDYATPGQIRLNYKEITSADLALVIAAMDTLVGDPNYNPVADLDGDGEVTSTDLSIVLANMH